MKYFSEYKNKLAVICVIILLVTLFQFYTFAASGTIYESEDNGSFSTADVTYDDYDNYGTIGSSSDYDYWKYTATYTGFANIWLGNIPSGCNYNLYMYNGSQAYMAVSMQSTGTQEIIRARVVSGQTYYIRVNTTYYSSTQNYLLRIKNNSLGYARLFTADYADALNTITSGSGSVSHLSNMGYNANNFPNYSASSAFDALPSTRIFMFSGHASTTLLEFYSSNMSSYIYLSGVSYPTMSSLSSTALSDVRLAIFCGCKTAENSSGNFVDMSLSKGASCAIGWTKLIKGGGINRWIPRFFNYCSQGMNVGGAMEETDKYMRENELDYFGNMGERYDGDSRPASIFI